MDWDQYWEEIYKTREHLVSMIDSYWSQYNHFGTWQFWTVAAFLGLPLILLYFTVDRKKIFELLFFGYTVHVFWAYTDIILDRFNFFTHLYMLTPALPFGLSMVSSALPVGFLLLYQYCINRQRSFYLYSLLLSAVFAFVFAPLVHAAGLVVFRKGMNFFYLFLIDVVVSYIAYWMTNFVHRLKVRQA